MKKPEPSLAPDRTPAEALERMKDFTRHILSVPKSELSKPKPSKRKRHS